MTALPLTAGTTLLIVLLMFGTAWNVGHKRGKYGVKAPAVSGHEQFERAYRIQMNTIEWALIFLPTLWIFAAFVSDRYATWAGLVGLAGRIWYAMAYQRDPAARGGGYLLGMLPFAVASMWAGVAVVRAIAAQ